MNKKNLLTLAIYLESLPHDYQHFGMRWFTDDFEDGAELVYATENGGLDQYGCNSVACAVGHGPSAGFLVPESCIKKWKNSVDVEWNKYSAKFFIDYETHQSEWNWCFGGGWSDEDNHHYGAAARIQYLLSGKPLPYNNSREIFDRDGNCIETLDAFTDNYTEEEEYVELYAEFRKEIPNVDA